MHIRPPLAPSPRLTRPWCLASVIVLLAGVSLPQPALAAPVKAIVGSLNTARFLHTVTLLPSGKVLVAGGYGASGLPRCARLACA